MSQSVTLRYTPTERDYAQVLRLFFWKRTGTRISLIFLVIAFALIIYAIASQGTAPNFLQLIWLLLPPLFVIYVVFIQPSRMASQAAKNEQLVVETTWEVSDEGVKMSSSYGTSNLEWEALSKLVATQEYYLLLSKKNKNALRFLPRRAFSSPQEHELFMELMQAHIPVK